MLKSKHWYESKTMWAGILLIVVGAYETVTGQNIDYNKYLTGLGLIGLRQAVD